MSGNRTKISDISVVAFDWLCAPDNPVKISTLLPEFTKFRFPIPEHIGEASTELLKLDTGFKLQHSTLIFRRGPSRLRLPHTTLRWENHEAQLALVVVLSGLIFVGSSVSKSHVTLDHETVGVFRRPAGRTDAQVKFDTQTPSDLYGLWICDTMLALLLGEDTAEKLIRALQLQRMPSDRTCPIPARISTTLRSSLPSSMKGDLRKLHAQAKTMEFLSLMANRVMGEETEDTGAHPTKTHKIRELREELDSMNGHIPKLDDLAERYGMSARSLNASFKQMYGQTIGAFVIEQRLNQAHAALVETDMAMKVLSARLGYSHVTHFIAAFKRKFGYPPGSLRR